MFPVCLVSAMLYVHLGDVVLGSWVVVVAAPGVDTMMTVVPLALTQEVVVVGSRVVRLMSGSQSGQQVRGFSGRVSPAGHFSQVVTLLSTSALLAPVRTHVYSMQGSSPVHLDPT